MIQKRLERTPLASVVVRACSILRASVVIDKTS